MQPATGKQQKLKVAIVGLQHLHPRMYMPLFNASPAFEVCAAMDADAKLLEDFGKDFNIRGYGDLDKLLAQETLDVAAIFLPHADCPEAAEKCAEKGLHLMVEKPMAASAAGARRIVDAARKNNVHLTTGYCWRLHPVSRELRSLIDRGAIGEIVGGEGRCAAGRLSRYIDGHSGWMLDRKISGGGPMYNLGVHWIDLFRWLIGDEVREVSGRNVKLNEEYNIEDNSFAHMRFSRGAIVSLDISYTVPDAFPHSRDLYVSIRGTRGVISWAPAFEGETDILFICSDDPEFAGSPNVRHTYELEPIPGYGGFMGLNYVNGFAEAIFSGARPAITGEDGVEALRIVEAIYRADERRAWVDLDD